MQLFAFGINHQTAPLAIREQVAFPSDRLALALQDLAGRREVKEAAILSTCNRTEIYCNTPAPEQAIAWLAAFHGLAPHAIQPYLYAHRQERAVRHAFRVASGLDSMVLGETQILGQMKDAVRAAASAGTLGVLLNKLFQRTFAVAKEVRSHTDIGAHSVSMAAAAVRLALRIFPTISEQAVLFIGAGEMIELCLTHFAAQRPRRIAIANRTVERAQALARKVDAATLTLPELSEALHHYDIVVSSTASPLPILGKGLVERAIRARKHRPMFMVDLAVPRDIEPEVGELPDVFLYTVDDLAHVVREGVDNRQAAAAQAEAIIETQVKSFMDWMAVRELVPTLRALRDLGERYRRQEIERAARKLARGEDPLKVMEYLSRALTNKLLHGPTHALHHIAAHERDDLEAWLKRLYHLHHE